jgi:quercetin dioxygenase-like cupin family protein
MKHVRYGLPLLLAAVFALGLAVGVVAAQPARPVATTVATGTLATPAHAVIVSHGEMGTVAGIADVAEVRVVRFELAPGGAFPWHRHPGPVWVVVTRGTLTFYGAACVAHAYPAGSAFFDPGNLTHTARNEGTEPLEVLATFMFPAGAGAPSVPQPAPESCPIEA